MADFNVQLSEPQAAGARPLAPVQRNVSRFENPYVGLASNLIGIFAQNREENRKQEALAEEQRVIGEFVREQNALVEAGRQGVAPERTAALARASSAKYFANYPGLIPKLTAARDTLVKHTELGVSEEAAQMVVDERKIMRKSYIDAGGIIPQGATPEEEAAILARHQETVRMQKEAEFRIKLNTEERNKEGADRARLDAQRKEEAVTLLSSLGATHLKDTQDRLEIWARDFKDPLKQEATQMEMAKHFSNIEGAIAQSAAFEPALAGQWRELFNNLKINGEKYMKGEIKAEMYKNLYEENVNKAAYLASREPEVAAVAGVNKLLNGNLPETWWGAAKASQGIVMRVANQLDDGVSNLPNIVGNKEAEKISVDLIKSNLNKLESGTLTDPEGVKVQLSNLTNNILSQVNSQAKQGIDPAALDNVSKFVASQEFVRLHKAGLIDQEKANTALNAMQLTYTKGLNRAFTTVLEKPFGQTTSGEQLTAKDVVQFNWNGAGVSITTGLQGVPLASGRSLDSAIIELQGTQNKVNQLIRMGAHLEGHTNYAKYWEENRHNIIPNYFPPPNVKPGVYEIEGVKMEYTGGFPWRSERFWKKVKDSERTAE